MKKALAAMAVVLMFVFSACGSDAGSPGTSGGNDPDNTNVTEHTKIVVDGDTDNHVYVFTTNDGTKCVFVDGDQESGLACDFGVDRP